MSTELTKTAKPKTAVSALVLGNADDTLKLAKELQKFVKDNSLTSTIQGKQFPNVEAWQFAGSLLGLSPMLESIEDKSTPDEIKWHATITLLNVHTGATVGRGFATCSNKEHTKRSFADYAICSMAQTRAVGKAYRLTLGWLMKAAGYEATPAEEMQEVGTEAAVVATPGKSQVEVIGRVSVTPEASAPAEPASTNQKHEILHLLQHEAFTDEDRNKAGTIGNWSAKKAENAINALKVRIVEHELNNA